MLCLYMEEKDVEMAKCKNIYSLDGKFFYPLYINLIISY